MLLSDLIGMDFSACNQKYVMPIQTCSISLGRGREGLEVL